MPDVQKIITPEGEEFGIVNGEFLKIPSEEKGFAETAFETEEGVLPTLVKDFVESTERFIQDPTAVTKQEALEFGGGGVSGFRDIPRTVASTLRLFGVKGPLNELNETARHFTPDNPGISFGLGQMLAQQFTAQVLTRGRALPLLVFGAGVQKSANELDEGQPLWKALLAGGFTSFFEYIGEKVPQTELAKKGKSYFKKLWNVWGADVLGEEGTYLAEVGLIDPLILNKELPSLIEIGKGMAKVAAITTLADPILVAGTQTGVLPSASQVAPNTPSTQSRIEQAQDVSPEVLSEADELLSRIKPEELSNIDAEILADAINPIVERNLIIEKKAPADTMQSLGEQQQFIQEQFNEAKPKLYTDKDTGAVVTSLEAQTNMAKDVAAVDKALRGNEFAEPIELTQAQREDTLEEFPELAKQEEKLVKRDDPLRLKQPTEFIVPEEVEPGLEAWEDDKVTKTMTRATESTKARRKITAKKVGAALTKQIFDRQGNVKRALLNANDPDAKRAKIRLENRAGSTAWSEYEMSKAYDATTRSLNGQERRMFNAVVQGMRALEISSFKPGFTHQGGLTAQNYSDNIKKIPDEKLAKIKPLAENYWGTIENKLQELVDAEVTTPESKARLKSTGEFYSPRNVLKYVDGGDNTFTQGGKKITVPDSGIKRLSDEGSLELIESDATELLHQVITRTNARIFNNKANQAMYAFALNSPDNGVVKIAPIVSTTKEGKIKFKPAPIGYQGFKVMIEGQPQEFHMVNELADEWTRGDAQINRVTAKTLDIISGSFILKPLATGLNPGFAFGNLPKDASHSWLVTDAWSPILPVAAYRMRQDYQETYKDALQKKGLYVDMLKAGGGMTLMSQEFKTSKLTGAVRAVEDKAGFLSEFSEIWTRLAIVNRSLKNGKSMEESVNIARNMLDFYQGGEFVKALDHGVPYLNAGTQGTKTILQAAKRNPAIFTAKLAQIGVLAAAIGSLWRYIDPDKEFQKDISLRDKTGFWTIPTPIVFTDKKKQKRMVYMKISKDQGQRVFASFFDNLWAAANGEPFDWDELKAAGKDFLSVTPEDLMPPTLDAWMGIKSNINFWTDERIYKEKFTGPVRPEEEFTRFTPEIFKALGQTTGTSPARLEYATRQIFTNGNLWTAMAGYPINKILEDADEETKDAVGNDLWIKLSRSPILKRFIGVTNPDNRLENERREAAIEENTRRLRLIRTFDELKGAVQRGEEPAEKMAGLLTSLDEDDLKRVLNREKKHRKLEEANLNDPSFWLRLQDLPTRAKAQIIFQEVMTTGPERKEALLQDLDSISASRILGLSSPAVKVQLKKLVEKERRSR